MKYAFLLVACLGSAIVTHAQASNPATDQNRINIIVSNDNISIACNGKTVVVHSNGALDSCLQKIIPGLTRPGFVLDTPEDMDPEKRRVIGAMLEKYHCPVASFRKFGPVSPAVTLRIDTVSH